MLEKAGRDIDTKGELTVVIGPGDVDAVDEPQERYMGKPITVVNAPLSRQARETAEAAAICSAVGRTPV